jgi:hypothetical protein
VRDFIKALCLTLMFFAYSFLLFGGGMFLQKQISNESEKENNQVVETQTDMNIAAHKTAEEYHKYYEIVVSRIKTTDMEGFNKKALDDYILAHNERLEALVNAFYPDKEDATKYGSSFPMVYANFKKAYEEAELYTYRTLMLAMSTMDIEEEVERIFKDNQAYNVNIQNTEIPNNIEGQEVQTENPVDDSASANQNNTVSENKNTEAPLTTPYY